MDHTLSNKKHHIKHQESIVILLIISLIFNIIGSISYFFEYTFTYTHSNNNYVYTITAHADKLKPVLPSALSIIILFLNLIPTILLILYIAKLHKIDKTAIIIPIFFASMALSSFISIISNYTFFIVELKAIDLFIANLIINLIFGISFILAAFSASKGLYNKVFIIIPIFLSFIYTLFNLYSFILYSSEQFLDDGMYLYLITNPAAYISQFALLAALLLFGLKNRIVPIIPVSEQKRNKRLKKMKPQKALKFLNDELYFGIITDEEYQEKRSEIILYIQNNI